MARNLVNLEGVGKAYGTRVLLDDVSLGVGEGDRIGVVGRNGDGKSTLLRLLTRRERRTPAGSPTPAACGSAQVGQRDDLDPTATVRSLVVGDGPAHEWAADAAGPRRAHRAVRRARRPRRDARPGGRPAVRRRAAPGGAGPALVGEHDLLVLDEPTNHLDVEGIDWLARHLVARREALVVVTHDRWFLDEVCERTWEVQGGAVHAYDGGYSAYVLARAERDRMQAADRRPAGATCCARSWPGCAAGRRRAPRSRGSASRRPTR